MNTLAAPACPAGNCPKCRKPLEPTTGTTRGYKGAFLVCLDCNHIERSRTKGKVSRPKKRTSLRSEHGEQAALIAKVKTLEGRYPPLRLLYAVPNGDFREKAAALRLQAEGVRPGVPDLCLPVARDDFHSLYIEMKVNDNKPTIDQQDYIKALREEGHRVEVCYSMESAWSILCDYLGIDEMSPIGELFHPVKSNLSEVVRLKKEGFGFNNGAITLQNLTF